MTRASDTARLVSGGAVFNEASNDVDFRVESNGDANMLFVDAGNDKIGIGTSSPSADLSVDGRITLGDQAGSGTAGAGSMIVGASSFFIQASEHKDSSTRVPIVFSNIGGSTESMRVDASGNLAIGTTSAAAKLHVESASGSITPSVHADELLVEGSGNSGITIGSGTSGLGSLRFADSGGDSQGNIAYDHSDNSLKIFTADSEAIRIISDGKVGIGGFNPAANLHVGGTGTPEIRLQDTDTSGGSLKITHNAGTSTISADPDNSSGSPTLIFSTANGERMRITSVGRINANTGVDTATAFRFFAPSGQATKVAEFAVQSGVGCHLPVNSTAFTASSDETLKENITEFNKQESYDNIKSLRAVTFNYKDWTLNGINYQDDKKRIGFIAQDWQTNYPEVIDKDQNDKLCMKYTETIPVLLSALQKAQEKIETLEAKVATLESK
jgi:hypothetical protein